VSAGEPPSGIRRRRLGRTGLQVSEVVFGAGFVGGLMVLKDDTIRLRALRTAIAAGINWVDTAPLYGQGRSEQALGVLLPELERQPYLSTKVALDPRSTEDIASQVERSVHASLARLRRGSVDLLQLHNRIGRDTGSSAVGEVSVQQVLGPGGVAEQLERLREQGVTRFTGLTALGDAGAIVETIDSGRFDTAQVYYNVLNPSAARDMPPAWTGHHFDGVLAACARQDVGALGIRVFASGALATDTRSGREVALTDDSDLELETRRARAAFQALAPLDGNRAQAALRFGLAQPALAAVIIGMAEPEHLDDAIAAAAMAPLPADALARLETVYERNFDQDAMP
jgi:L-glyceraldehyde 3-phosphate reductase